MRADLFPVDQVSRRRGQSLPLGGMFGDFEITCSVLWGTAFLGLTLGVPAASAGPAAAAGRAYQAWRSAITSSLKIPGGSAGSELSSAKPAPVAGGQVVTTADYDTDGDGSVDQRSITTTNFDKAGRVVRTADEFDTAADGTVEARTVVTTEYDKSGNAIRQVSVSNINDLGSGGDGSVYETATAVTTYNAKNHPVRLVAELDEDSNGTLESRSTTTYVNDASGNVLQTVSETDEGADGRWTFAFALSRPTIEKATSSVRRVRATTPPPTRAGLPLPNYDVVRRGWKLRRADGGVR